MPTARNGAESPLAVNGLEHQPATRFTVTQPQSRFVAFPSIVRITRRDASLAQVASLRRGRNDFPYEPRQASAVDVFAMRHGGLQCSNGANRGRAAGGALIRPSVN